MMKCDICYVTVKRHAEEVMMPAFLEEVEIAVHCKFRPSGWEKYQFLSHFPARVRQSTS